MVKQLYSIIRLKASLNRSTGTNAILQFEMICLPIRKIEKERIVGSDAGSAEREPKGCVGKGGFRI